MALGFISYSVVNDKAFADQLDRAFAVVDDLTVPFQLIAADFYRSEDAIFQLGGPGQYPPFKGSSGKSTIGKNGKRRKYVATDRSAYQVRKLKKYGFDYPLLKASGELEASVTSPDAPGSLLIIGPHVLAIGTTLPYAIYPQSDEPRTTQPLRKFLFVGAESEWNVNSDQVGRLSRWNNIINTFILRQMGVSFGASR